jgi:misacylated tRNA(Ala) deacylase
MELLYLNDSYIRQFAAKVVKKENNLITLDRTAFYPGGGGLENDTGFLIRGNDRLRVKRVFESEGRVVHEIEGEIHEGDEVVGEVDWNRRYKMMRLHTASHVIASIAFNKYKALITGGHISEEYAKDDFDVDKKEVLSEIIREANEVIKRSINVKVYFLKREEARKIEGIVKLANRHPPSSDVWRIVEIEGIDIQADGGPHVRNTSEIGEVVLLKVENKGKGRKRVYYTVKP